MLNQQTAQRLREMRLTGMAEALLEQSQNAEIQSYTFEERLGLLVDHEYISRQNRRLARLLKQAKLRLPASLEDIDYQKSRGLDRALLRSLETCEWIGSRLNCLVSGATGTGKTFLVCALANAACRRDLSARYYRVSNLLAELTAARGDGSYHHLIYQLTGYDLLVLDDWGLAPFKDFEGHDLLDVIEERHGRGSLIIASQLPFQDWHETLPDPTVADAIMDRIIHNSHRILLTGPSMRKVLANKQAAATS
jgi:DNA replication protein DnaC